MENYAHKAPRVSSTGIMGNGEKTTMTTVTNNNYPRDFQGKDRVTDVVTGWTRNHTRLVT